jgi:hypothetical protein
MARVASVVHENGNQLFRKLTQPASGGVVGDPCLVGDRPGFLLTDQDANGYATVKFNGSHRVLSHGANAAGNAASAISAPAYYDAAPGGGNPFINADATNGVRFGTFTEALASGAKVAVIVDLHG